MTTTTAAVLNPVLATAVLAASTANFLQPINIANMQSLETQLLSPADEELRQRMARNERNCHTELLPEFLEITSMCHDAVVTGNFEVFQHVRAAISKLKRDVAQQYFPNLINNKKKAAAATKKEISIFQENGIN